MPRSSVVRTRLRKVRDLGLTDALCSCYVLTIAEPRRADERRRTAPLPRRKGIEGLARNRQSLQTPGEMKDWRLLR